MSELSRRAAVVGIGATDFSKDSGRSELRLAAEAVRAALADAGLRPADVDGLTSFTMDTNTEIAVARAVGIPSLKFFSRVHYGGGAACATVQQAAMAVATGVAEVVVVYRAFNERSGARYGQVNTALSTQVNSSGTDYAFSYPHGLGTPASFVAMAARRYMHVTGATSADFGKVAVAARRHAATNPHAFFHGKPITLDDHQNSRWIAEPLHLLDCCQESDGGCRARRHHHRTGPGPAAAARRGGGRRAGQRTGPVHHGQLLPGRADGAARDGHRRPPAVGAVRSRPAGRADGRALRPLHPVRAHAARGTRLLRTR